jgi:hypothetical protein
MKYEKRQELVEEIIRGVAGLDRVQLSEEREARKAAFRNLGERFKPIERFLPALQRDSVDIVERLETLEKQNRHLAHVIKTLTEKMETEPTDRNWKGEAQ